MLIGAGVTILSNILIDKRNYKKLRDIAIESITIFEKYANKSYDYSRNEFNSRLDRTKKRMILVLLSKLGIPIVSGIKNSFDIDNVEFDKNQIISLIELHNIKEQINSGNCDNLFFIDSEEYFNKDTTRNYRRSLAIRYVEKIFSTSTLDIDKKTVKFKVKNNEVFSVGEIYAIDVFIAKLLNPDYFDIEDKTKPSEQIINKLINEINIGIWDSYLSCTSEAYCNIILQADAAKKIVNTSHQ